MPLESRRIAAFLLIEPNDGAWWHAIEVENILQKNTPATARRQARLIRCRLLTLDVAGWQMIAEQDQEVAVQMLLVAAVKHGVVQNRVPLSRATSRVDESGWV